MKYCLFVSPNFHDQDIFKKAFRRMSPGDECITVTNAREAFRAIHEKSIIPDLVCVERHMKAVDGIEFLRMLKRVEYLKNIPVVVQSSSIAQDDIDELKHLGVAAILLKPHDFYSVCTMLALYFGLELIAVCQN